MSIKNIIFDWSGTLSDDLTKVYSAVMIIFKKWGRESISIDEFKREFTLPYMLFWVKYFPQITKEEVDTNFTKAIHTVGEPVLYPGVKKELMRLHKAGIRMIIISSHVHEKLMKEAKDQGVKSLFQEIYGSIHDKTEAIRGILQKNNFLPEETLYVGDMTHDIEAGKKAGVVTVALGWGYQTKEKLASAEPDHFIEDIKGLGKFLH